MKWKCFPGKKENEKREKGDSDTFEILVSYRYWTRRRGLKNISSNATISLSAACLSQLSCELIVLFNLVESSIKIEIL